MKSIVNRLWNASPAKLTHSLQYQVWRLRQKPGWFTITGGPAKGAQLFLPNAEEGAWREMLAGTFDSFLYDALSGRQLQGATCWDIGAHIGYHSLGFAALGAQVVAFEPNVENAERLRMHLSKNQDLAKRIRLNTAAVSDRDGRMSFVQGNRIEAGSSGSHLAEAMAPSEMGPGFEEVIVTSVKADTLVADGEVPPDLIKIDVEGGERLVLEGARQLLETKKPVLLIEVHHICLMLHVQNLVFDLGYRVSLLDEANASPSRCFILATSKGIA